MSAHGSARNTRERIAEGVRRRAAEKRASRRSRGVEDLTAMVTLRVTPSERDHLRRLAAEAGVRFSDYLRQVLLPASACSTPKPASARNTRVRVRRPKVPS